MKDGGFALQPGDANVPSTTRANGFWDINEANNRWSNLDYQWPGGADPNYSSVVGLWHGFSLPAAGFLDYKQVPDNGPTGSLTMTFFGQFGELGVSDSGAKFGTQCMTCQAASAGNFATASTTWAPGSGDWTLEGWIYDPTAQVAFIYEGRPNPPGASLHPTVYVNNGKLTFYSAAIGDLIVAGSAWSFATWHHWAVSKASNQTRAFVDGVQVGSTYADTNNYLAPQILLFATSNGTQPFVGRMQEFRITQGVGRYTTTFPVPVYPFPDF